MGAGMPTDDLECLLIKGADQLHIQLDKTQSHLFMLYLREIKAWNEKFNLTAITGDAEIIIKHFLDSISIYDKFDIPKGCRVIDVGAGAGLPGIPIKIVRPDIELTLLESSRKKAAFLEHAITALDLKGAVAVAQRAEDFGRRAESREKYCLAVSRAVADLVVLVEYALPLIEVNGRFVCYKSKRGKEEAIEAEKAINLLGGRIEEIARVVVPFLNAERYLVSIRKVATSPHKYPRKTGIPAKKPLL